MFKPVIFHRKHQGKSPFLLGNLHLSWLNPWLFPTVAAAPQAHETPLAPDVQHGNGPDEAQQRRHGQDPHGPAAVQQSAEFHLLVDVVLHLEINTTPKEKTKYMCIYIYIYIYVCVVEGTMIHDCMCIVGHRRPPRPSQTTTVVGGKGLIIQAGENRVFQAG